VALPTETMQHFAQVVDHHLLPLLSNQSLQSRLFDLQFQQHHTEYPLRECVIITLTFQHNTSAVDVEGQSAETMRDSMVI
jgi:hypothetical protein